ncbi:acyl carrier protein [Rhodanobacter sp. BL-MT-08]
MNIETFVERFAFAIEADASSLTPETDYKKMENWDSLNALSLIAMADTEYDVVLTGQDILTTHTIRDLYEVVEAKSAKS